MGSFGFLVECHSCTYIQRLRHIRFRCSQKRQCGSREYFSSLAYLQCFCLLIRASTWLFLTTRIKLAMAIINRTSSSKLSSQRETWIILSIASPLRTGTPRPVRRGWTSITLFSHPAMGTCSMDLSAPLEVAMRADHTQNSARRYCLGRHKS